MSVKNPYVYLLNEQTVFQVIIHIITILALAASVVITVLVLVLLIKLMTRGIKALDIL